MHYYSGNLLNVFQMFVFLFFSISSQSPLPHGFVFHQFSVFYVTLQTGDRLTDSTSKIEAIVAQITKLRDEDSTVKIVIFSQWSNILKVLEDALEKTNISFRSRLEKFYKTIEEFKVCFVQIETFFVSFFLCLCACVGLKKRPKDTQEKFTANKIERKCSFCFLHNFSIFFFAIRILI